MGKIRGQIISILDRGRIPFKAVREDYKRYKPIGTIDFKSDEVVETNKGVMLAINEHFEESGYKIDRENIEIVQAQVIPILNDKNEFVGNVLINLKTKEAVDGLINCKGKHGEEEFVFGHRIGSILTFM